MVRTAVLVSGGGRNLQAIIDSRLFGEIPNCDIASVISSNPEAYALTRARAAGIDAFVVDREIFPNAQSFNEALYHKLRDLDIELVVLAGFTHRLSDAIINSWRNRIINVHPSLLPAFSGEGMDGAAPHEAAIAAGVRISGATAYFVSEVPRRGPIILQQAVPVLQDDTPASLQERVMEQAEWSILPQAVALYCTGALRVENGLVKISV
ncbi:MAG: phosphoribosylglycinamide formyltransferase [Candidatus Heteroscillospira sp.]|jgi:phosphoribosylglycinamide formyltransferase-1